MTDSSGQFCLFRDVFVLLGFALAFVLLFRRLGTGATLDPKPTTFAHRDGADFGLWGGARKEQCCGIVTDEQRCHRPKSARPAGLAKAAHWTALRLLQGQPAPAACRALPVRFLDQSRRANVVGFGSRTERLVLAAQGRRQTRFP